MPSYFPRWLSELVKEIFSITLSLFKIMIPVIIIVKIIEELGWIKYIAFVLEPLMELVGLPASMGLVWATTMITNMYGGMIIFITSTTQETLTVAQVTVLGGMMLIAHTLPIEVRIAQKAGIRVLYTLILRIGGALLFGFVLYQIYNTGDFLSQTNHALWQPNINNDHSLVSWVISQLKVLAQVFVIISGLVIFLKLLKLSHIEKLFTLILKPLLKVIGLGERTTSITLIGMTLGLAYGGGLLINEANKGHISKIDIFGSLSLLAFCHSLIEDTLLIMLLGADISGALYFRLVFSLTMIAIIMRLVKQLKPTMLTRYFIYPEKK